MGVERLRRFDSYLVSQLPGDALDADSSYMAVDRVRFPSLVQNINRHMKKYTVYLVTNTINGKVYIGKHETLNIDDGYMGSGKLVKRALNKHGVDNFKKEILYVFETEEEMNAKEALLVTDEFCSRDDTYNICAGGKGGFGYINAKGLNVSDRQKQIARKNITEARAKLTTKDLSNNNKKGIVIRTEARNRKYPNGTFCGRTHTEQTKIKMRAAHKNHGIGQHNSQYGSKWITNGVVNKKIKKDENLPIGWYRGRCP